jgi:hypothetical protein
VVRAEGVEADAERLLVERRGLVVAALVLEVECEVVAGRRQPVAVVALRRPQGLHRRAVERLGLGVARLPVDVAGQVVVGHARRGVVFPLQPGGDLQGLLQQLPGLREAAPLLQGHRQVAVDRPDARVVLAHGSAVDLQGLAVPRLGVGVPLGAVEQEPALVGGQGHVGVVPEQAAVDVQDLLGRPQRVGVAPFLVKLAELVPQPVGLHVLQPARLRQGGELLQPLDLPPVVGGGVVVLPQHAGAEGQDFADGRLGLVVPPLALPAEGDGLRVLLAHPPGVLPGEVPRRGGLLLAPGGGRLPGRPARGQGQHAEHERERKGEEPHR